MLIFLLFLAAGRDWLGGEFSRELEDRARSACGREFRVELGAKAPVAAIRQLVKGEEGKEIYVQFLKDRYGYAIGQINEIYGLDATSFTELLTRDFREVDGAKREVRADDAAFLGVVLAYWERAVERGGKRCGGKGRANLRVDGEALVVSGAK